MVVGIRRAHKCLHTAFGFLFRVITAAVRANISFALLGTRYYATHSTLTIFFNIQCSIMKPHKTVYRKGTELLVERVLET